MLVTAPLRGAALDELRGIADVVFDPWIEHRPIKLYGPDDFAARIRAEGAAHRRVRGRLVQGAGAGAAADRHRLHPGPTRQRRCRRGHRRGHSCAARTGPQCRRRGRDDGGPTDGRQPLRGRRRPRRASGHDVRQDPPLPARYRAWQMAGRTARARGIRGCGPGHEMAAGGSGHDGDRQRSLRRRRHPQPQRPTGRRRRGVDARRGDARDPENDGRRPVRGDEAGRDLSQHRPGHAARHRRPGGRIGVGASRRRRTRPLRRRDPAHRPSPHRHEQRGAHPPHRRGHLRRREQPQAAIVVADIKAILAGNKPLHCANPEVFK